MTVPVANTKWVHSQYRTNTGVNGGRSTHTQIIGGARNNIHPRVTKTERTNGISYRDRKAFFRNMSPDDEPMYSVMAVSEVPTNAGDRILIGLGTQSNQQADWESYPPIFTGTGELETALSGGETQVSALMEDTDFEFVSDGYIRICDNVLLSQTIGSTVKIGDSVQDISGTWTKIASTNDYAYPKGAYLGGNKVLTYTTETQENFLQLVSGLVENESVGTGATGNASPTLSTLADAARGVVGNWAYAPTIKATCGGVERTITVGPDGTCSGYCSAGEMDLSDGSWVTTITWTTEPDDGTDITANYYQKNYSYAGNVVTVYLSETVPGAFSSDGSCMVSGCIGPKDVEPSVSDWSETFASTGAYDETTYPVETYCDGTEEDAWTIQFTSSSTFTLSGVNAGTSIATGSISSDFSPENPDTGQPYFTIRSSGWSGTIQSGDTVSFKTHDASFPIIAREKVPALTDAVQTNFTTYYICWE